LLRIAINATFQATSAIDGPAAVAWSGKLRPPYRGDCFRRRAFVRATRARDRFATKHP
jgi:hypothetical protein